MTNHCIVKSLFFFFRTSEESKSIEVSAIAMDNCECSDPALSVSSSSPESTATNEAVTRKKSIEKTAQDQFFTSITKNEKKLVGEVSVV